MKRPVHAQPLELQDDMTVEQAAHAILLNCLTQIEANREQVAGGHSPESVHQMRVGLRRLRSALDLFEDVIRPGSRLSREITWLGGELGPARDWDVLGTHLPQIEELRPLRRAVRSHARQMRSAAGSAIATKRFDALLHSLHHFIDTAAWRKPASDTQVKALAQPATKFAGNSLQQARRRVEKRGGKLKNGTPRARHRLRIAMKKLRYATEFFQCLSNRKRTRRALKGMTGLQDELGWINDVAVADGLLQHFHQTDPQLDQQAGFARGYLAAELEGRVRKLEREWKKNASAALAH